MFINKTGNSHKAAYKVDNVSLWGDTEAPGEVNVWLHEGQQLTMTYGGWAGQNGSFGDQWYILIHVFDQPETSTFLTFNGQVSGTLNPTTVTSGTPLSAIIVPSGKIYNIKNLFINKTGNSHKAVYKVDNVPLWGDTEAPGEVNFWLHEGQQLTMTYGGWWGQNGSFGDQWYILIHVFEP